MDITLAPGPDGKQLVAHDPGCPEVQVMRDAGEPLMTLFEIEGGLDRLPCAKHACLTREKRR